MIEMVVRRVAENGYVRAVRRDGSLPAQQVVGRVFRVSDRAWRGIGATPLSGLEL